MSPDAASQARRSTEADRSDAATARERVVVPVFGAVPEPAMQIGRHAAAARDGELTALDVRCGDEESVEVDRAALETAPGVRDGDDLCVREIDGTAGPVDAVVDAASTLDAGLVVVDERAVGPLSGPIRGNAARRISQGVACDSVVVSDNRDHETIASILVPVSDGPHSETAVDVAGAVASAAGAWVELLHVVDDEADDDALTRAAELLDGFAARLPDDVETERWIFDEGAVADVVVDQSTYYDLTVIGAPDSNRLKRLVFGSVPGSIRDRAENTVLVARRGHGKPGD